MTTYKIYGLTIDSCIDLHVAASDTGDADVTVRTSDRPSIPFPELLRSNHFDVEYQRLYWPFAGAVEIFEGKDVVLTPIEGFESQIFSFAILGPVAALLLHYREFLTIHASCASIFGRGVAFMGDKGAGKSTITAATVAAGHRFIADDIAAIKKNGSLDICRPGYPLMKVSEQSLAAFPALLDKHSEVLTKTVEDKKLLRFSGIPEDDVALTALFVLKRGQQPSVQRLTASEAYSAVMRFSYPIRFGTAVLKAKGSRKFAGYIAEVASRTPVFELTVADGLSRYLETLAKVEKAVSSDV